MDRFVIKRFGPAFLVFFLGMLAANFNTIQGDNVSVTFSETDMDIVIGETKHVTLKISQAPTEDAEIYFIYEDSSNDVHSYIEIIPNISIKANSSIESWKLNITGHKAGHMVLSINSSSPQFVGLGRDFIRMNVIHNFPLVIVCAVIGWIYFVAWSVSFYPQVYINWKRKSVVGLSFDFLLYNITGFLSYGFFNIGMFWVGTVKEEYREKHKHGINPVQLNDVIFTIHAVFITAITIFQCFIYERGNQKPSKLSIVLASGAWTFAIIAFFVTIGHKITWLTFLYYFSYIKLAVTLIKYIPQAVMNFRRKSTEGWSIGNVLLDFTGGSLSLVQMMLLAYNSDDWESLFGDMTKFGLGMFSILFDVLFIIQHYILYRGKSAYDKLDQEQEVVINKDSESRNIY